MRLLDYMRRENLDDAAMAERVGNCSAHAIKKWKYRERTPDARRISRIEEITGGEVSLPDWIQSPDTAPEETGCAA